MTSREFCYWLQGMFEISRAGASPEDKFSFDESQTACVEKHLAMVFKHEIDPSYSDAKALNKIHAKTNPDGPLGPRLRC